MTLEMSSRLKTRDIKNNQNIEAARTLIEEDRRMNQLANFIDISYESANFILHNAVELSKLSARWSQKRCP